MGVEVFLIVGLVSNFYLYQRVGLIELFSKCEHLFIKSSNFSPTFKNMSIRRPTDIHTQCIINVSMVSITDYFYNSRLYLFNLHPLLFPWVWQVLVLQFLHLISSSKPLQNICRRSSITYWPSF